MQHLTYVVDAMTKSRHDAGCRAKLAQPLAADAIGPFDDVFAVEVREHDRGFVREAVVLGHDQMKALAKQRPDPHPLMRGSALAQDDQIGISLQDGFANCVLGASLDVEFEVRHPAAHAVEDVDKEMARDGTGKAEPQSGNVAALESLRQRARRLRGQIALLDMREAWHGRARSDGYWRARDETAGRPIRPPDS